MKSGRAWIACSLSAVSK